MKTLLALALTCLGVRAAYAACDALPHRHSSSVDGLDLASGNLTSLQIAELGPIAVFYSECGADTSGLSFATPGVFANVDAFIRVYPDGNLGVIAVDGETAYQAAPGTEALRRVPDDGSYFTRGSDGSYVRRSFGDRDEQTYRRFGTQLLLAEEVHYDGDAGSPFAITTVFDRDATGALVGIHESNSGDRIQIDRDADSVRVQLFLAGKQTPADWFTLHRSGGRLGSVEFPGPLGSALVRYTISDAGRVLSVDHPSGATTEYLHDFAGRVRDVFVYQTDDASGAKQVLDHVTYTYEGTRLGPITSVRRDGDGSAEAARYQFDAWGRVVAESIGGTDVLIRSYDDRERVASETFPERNQTLSYFYYGGSETLLAVRRQDGRLVYMLTGIDPASYRPTSYVEDGVGPTAITYDALGRVASVTQRDNHAWAMTVTAADSAAIVDTCTTDSLIGTRACTRVDYGRGGAVISVTDGQVGVLEADRVTTYDLDASNLVARATERVGNTVTRVRTFGAYDDRGLPASTTVLDAVLGGPAQITTYSYFADGSVATATDEEGFTVSNTYDAIGQLRERRLQNLLLGGVRAGAALGTKTWGKKSDCVNPASVSINGALVATIDPTHPGQIVPPLDPINDGPPPAGAPPGAMLPPNLLGPGQQPPGQLPPGQFPPGNPPGSSLPPAYNGTRYPGGGFLYRPPLLTAQPFWPITLETPPGSPPDVCGIEYFTCNRPVGTPGHYEPGVGYTPPVPASRIWVYCKPTNPFVFPHGTPPPGVNWEDMPAFENGACASGPICVAATGALAGFATTTMGDCLHVPAAANANGGVPVNVPPAPDPQNLDGVDDAPSLDDLINAVLGACGGTTYGGAATGTMCGT
jgi:YD repeat-containing protein